MCIRDRPGTAPTAPACNGDMVYSFTYTDCATRSHVWTYTYHLYTSDAADERSRVDLGGRRTTTKKPTPPVVKDTCGNVLTPQPGTAPTAPACNGDMVYSFTYTDCATRSHVWTY